MTSPTQAKEEWEERFERIIGGGLFSNPDYKAQVLAFILSEKETSYLQGCKDTEEAMREILTKD